MEVKAAYDERRSVNFFDPAKKLDDSLLKAIINMAVLAPSAFNLQPWRIIAVKSEAAKHKLYPLTNKQAKILEAPVTLIMVGDKKGYATTNPVWEEMRAALNMTPEALAKTQGFATSLYGANEERRIKFAESNAGLLAMSVMTAAQSMGVASHAMSGMDFDGVREAFGLDEDQSVVMLIALGYFDESKSLYPRRPRRLYDDIVEEV